MHGHLGFSEYRDFLSHQGIVLGKGLTPSRLNMIKTKNRNIPSPGKAVDWSKYIDGDLPKLVVPVGVRFQVFVPKWKDPSNEASSSRSYDLEDTSRWLGTQIWPLQGENLLSGEGKAGKGRPYSCTCSFPGFTQCVKLHQSEARKRLQYELGPAYRIWKFDEMGEDVGKSWTSNQKTRFDHLVMRNPLSEGKTFLKTAEAWFPSKKRKDIVSYYLNVHVPKRIRTLTRSGCKELDSDDDEIEEARNVDISLKRCSVLDSDDDVIEEASIVEKSFKRSRPNHGGIKQLVRSHYLTGRR